MRLPICLVVAAAATAPAPPSHVCTNNESDANNDAFMALGGKHASACPKSAVWVGPLARDCLPEEHTHSALVVGGNKGYDCVGWARLVTGNVDISSQKWTNRLRLVTGRERIPCGACKQCRGDYPLVAASHDKPVAYGFVACVEPLPANVDVLIEAARAEF